MYMQEIDAEIIIVGSGISGLTAAYTLFEKDPSLNVLVLEKSDRAGGRVLSVPLKVGENAFSTFDLGAEYIHKGQEEVLTFLQKNEISMKRLDVQNQSAIFKLAGQNIVVKSGDNIFNNLTSMDRLQFARFIVNIETLCRNVRNKSSFNIIAELSNKSLTEYIEHIVESKNVQNIIRYVILNNFGVCPSKISVLFYIFYCISHKGVDHQLICLRDQKDYLSFVGGVQSVCDKIIKDIGRSCLIKSQEVVSVKYYEHFVQVSTKEKSYVCHSVIMAVSPKSALSISFIPTLSSDKLQAFSKTRSGITTKFVIVYCKDFWRLMGFSGGIYFLDECIISPNVALLYFCDVSNHYRAALSGKLIEYGDSPSQYSGRYKNIILHKLSRYFGAECLNPVDYYEYSWRDDLGKTFTWDFGVISYIDAVTSSNERIYWAGAETSAEWYGSLAGAVHSGIRTAVQALYARRPSVLTSSDMDILSPILRKKIKLKEHYDPVYKSVVYWKYYSALLVAIVLVTWKLRQYIVK